MRTGVRQHPCRAEDPDLNDPFEVGRRKLGDRLVRAELEAIAGRGIEQVPQVKSVPTTAAVPPLLRTPRTTCSPSCAARPVATIVATASARARTIFAPEFLVAPVKSATVLVSASTISALF
jgi:hypothetical protein